jgi:protein-tyrosine phosphatase
MEIQADMQPKTTSGQPEAISQPAGQQQQSTNGSSQDMYNDFIGAIKIRDGLFIGDQLAAQDYEFVVTNKVTHIINTSGLQIRNYWESIGVQYLTFDWVDQDCQVILDSNNNNADRIYNFIEEAYEQGESCLVHSVRGQSRASTVLAAFFMKKYKWSLYKTIEFLNNRRPDLEIRASFIRQLSYYEKRLLQETGVQSDAWTELASKPHLENDELILTHTFLNAQMGPFADFSKSDSTSEINDKSKLKWVDERQSQKQLLITNYSKDDLIYKETVNKVTNHHNQTANKSIIKVPFDRFFVDNN